jgi:hypothetical protein
MNKARARAANIWDEVNPLGRQTSTLERRKKQVKALVKHMKSMKNAFSTDQVRDYKTLYDQFSDDTQLQKFEDDASNELHPGEFDKDGKYYLGLTDVLPQRGWPLSSDFDVKIDPDIQVAGVDTGIYDGISSDLPLKVRSIEEKFVPGMKVEFVPSAAWCMMALRAFLLVRDRHAPTAEFAKQFSNNGAAFEKWCSPHPMFDWILTELAPSLPKTESKIRVYLSHLPGKKLAVGTFWPLGRVWKTGVADASECVVFVDLPQGSAVVLAPSNWQPCCVIFDAALASTAEPLRKLFVNEE